MSDVFSDFRAIKTDGFGEGFLKRHGEAAAKVSAFDNALAGHPEAAAHLETLKTNVATAEKAIKDLGESPDTKILGEKQADLVKAQSARSDYLTGAAKEGPQAPEALKTAYNEAQKATTSITNTMKSSIHGRLSTTGFSATLRHNGAQMKNAFTKAGEGARVGGFARIGAITAGAALTGHAMFKGQTADGEKRSVIGRVLEGGVGVGLMAGGALAGSFAR